MVGQVVCSDNDFFPTDSIKQPLGHLKKILISLWCCGFYSISCLQPSHWIKNSGHDILLSWCFWLPPFWVLHSWITVCTVSSYPLCSILPIVLWPCLCVLACNSASVWTSCLLGLLLELPFTGLLNWVHSIIDVTFLTKLTWSFFWSTS